MAVSVTKRWSPDRRAEGEVRSAYREYDVTGTSSETTALAASGIPQLNDALSLGSPLKCKGPRVSSRPSLEHWVIACDFEVTKTGSLTSQNDNPLLQPTRISWEQVETSLPVDKDLDGRPLLYSNGKPIDGATNTFQWLRFSCVKNYSSFNINWVTTYANSVNSAALTISGTTFAIQHLRCCSVLPAAEYDTNATYIPVRWTFEVIPYLLLGSYPFQFRFMDQGESGWWSDSGTKREAKFTQANVASAAENTSGQWDPVGVIRMDGTGKPLTSAYSSVKVGPGHTPATVNSTISVYDLEYYPSGSSASTAAAVWAVYKKTRLVDFSGIPL